MCAAKPEVTTIPVYATAMVRRQPPPDAPVVPRSTPVVAFGDPSQAEVASLGINPSKAEFLRHGKLLAGPERRLATLDSLSAERLDELSDEQVGTVVQDCASYFQRNPYRRWFDPLDAILRAGTDTSYYDASACHLDLVQWATDPVWSGITDRAVRDRLLEDGVPHLRAQLDRENVRIVVLNGRQVIDQVCRLGLADLEEAAVLPMSTTTCRLYLGQGSGVRWVGWSTNLQSSRGVSRAFKEELALWLADAIGPSRRTEPFAGPVAVDRDAYLPREQLSGKQQLVEALAQWMAASAAETIGDVGSFGGRAWLTVALAGGHIVVLNADTKRSAVESFVRTHRRAPERPWRVVGNRRGRINKVLPGPGREHLPGWYAYLLEPLDEEALI